MSSLYAVHELIPDNCPECGDSTDTCLEWTLDKRNNSGIADGFLRMHDIGIVVVLGCMSCSATIATMDADLMMAAINEAWQEEGGLP